MSKTHLRPLLGAILAATAVGVATAAELKPRTVEAFDRYVAVTESRMRTELEGEAPFLRVDRLADDARAEVQAELRAGQVVIEKLETRVEGDKIDIPDGTVNHLVGTVLIPETTLEETIAMVQDYERYAQIYAPQVSESRLLSRDGNRFRAYTQTYKKKVITAVHNTEHDVEFIYLDGHRVHAPSYSTRIQEVEHPDSSEEREKPEGNDRGIVWRLYNYCSFEERSGDTYMPCESITLSREFNFFQNLVIRPFIAGLPEELMTFTLGAARRYLTQ